jgi:hypothetical protein
MHALLDCYRAHAGVSAFALAWSHCAPPGGVRKVRRHPQALRTLRQLVAQLIQTKVERNNAAAPEPVPAALRVLGKAAVAWLAAWPGGGHRDRAGDACVLPLARGPAISLPFGRLLAPRSW